MKTIENLYEEGNANTTLEKINLLKKTFNVRGGISRCGCGKSESEELEIDLHCLETIYESYIKRNKL
jgi:hypothetical protein